MQIQSINSYSVNNQMNKKQNPNFGELILSPTLKKTCSSELIENLNKLTDGVDALVTSNGCYVQRGSKSPGLIGTLRSMLDSLANPTQVDLYQSGTVTKDNALAFVAQTVNKFKAPIN